MKGKKKKTRAARRETACGNRPLLQRIMRGRDEPQSALALHLSLFGGRFCLMLGSAIPSRVVVHCVPNRVRSGRMLRDGEERIGGHPRGTVESFQAFVRQHEHAESSPPVRTRRADGVVGGWAQGREHREDAVHVFIALPSVVRLPRAAAQQRARRGSVLLKARG